MPAALLLTVLAAIGVGIAATLLLSRPAASAERSVAPDVGVGTVRKITDVITMEVESVTGVKFTGRLRDGPHSTGCSGVSRPASRTSSKSSPTPMCTR